MKSSVIKEMSSSEIRERIENEKSMFLKLRMNHLVEKENALATRTLQGFDNTLPTMSVEEASDLLGFAGDGRRGTHAFGKALETVSNFPHLVKKVYREIRVGGNQVIEDRFPDLDGFKKYK